MSGSIPDEILSRMADAMLDPILRGNGVQTTRTGNVVRKQVLERALRAAAVLGWHLHGQPLIPKKTSDWPPAALAWIERLPRDGSAVSTDGLRGNGEGLLWLCHNGLAEWIGNDMFRRTARGRELSLS